MFEAHTMLFEAAKSFALAGGFINECISLAICILDLVYLMHLIAIPFYIKAIAKHTGRKYEH